MKYLFLTLMILSAPARAASDPDGCDGLLHTYTARDGYNRVYENCVIREPALGSGHRLTLELFHSSSQPNLNGLTPSEWMLVDDTGNIDVDFIHLRNAPSGSTWESQLRCSGSSLHVVNRSRDGTEWTGDIQAGASSTKISLHSPQHRFAVEAECK